MNAQDLEQRARELLAAECEKDGCPITASILRDYRAVRSDLAACAIRTIVALIAERDALRELIEAAGKVKRAYWLARNSAAGLTNYCPESANSRRCERELDEAERIYRDSGFEAVLALTTGESA